MVMVGARGLSVREEEEREEGWREKARPWWSVAWCFPLLLLVVGALLFLVVGAETTPRHIPAGAGVGEGARRPARLLSLLLSSSFRSGCGVCVYVYVCVCWARPLSVCLSVSDQPHCLHHHCSASTADAEPVLLLAQSGSAPPQELSWVYVWSPLGPLAVFSSVCLA